MTSPYLDFHFNQQQIDIAESYEASGDLPGMYRYLSQQVMNGGGDPRLSNWLATAADINEGTGFYADFVRGATYSAGQKNDVHIDADIFQRASDQLAISVFETLARDHSLSLDRVIKSDVGVAVNSLGLPLDGWAGTLGAMFPTGVGGLGMSPETATFYNDLNASYAETGLAPLDRAGRFFDLVGNDFEGFLDGSRGWWNENVAGPEDWGTLGDIGFWNWMAQGVLDGLQRTGGAVGDPGAWEAWAEGVTNLWRDAGTAIGNTADYWFSPLWKEITDALLGGLDLGIQSAAQGINHNTTYRIQRYDPLALDLDGDGKVSTLAESNWTGALFDHNGDGIRTASGWVAGNDGLLVRDLDGNGTIDSGRELFGDQTVLRNGQRAANGFDALADLDDNGDGVIDANDAAFGSLRVWRDLNGDGISQANELFTLDDLGIVSLSLTHS
ncbi:hypothetical protein ABIC75_003662, partial [Dyella japonica]